MGESVSSGCLNCGCASVGRFCPECGQPAATARYRFASFGREFYDQMKKIDLATTTGTFWQLLRRPGGFVRDYLEGRRVGFAPPVKYFFYSFVSQVLLSGWIVWLTGDRTLASLQSIDLRMEILMLISTVFWGLLWALMYRRSELNTVENIVAAIYFIAQTNYYSILLTVAALPLTRLGAGLAEAEALIEILIVPVYAFVFARGLFRESVIPTVLKQSVLALLFLVVTIATLTGGLIASRLFEQLAK